MTHETLDETIDRVAGEMSAGPSDPRLAARVRERMHVTRPPWAMAALASVCVAGVIVSAIMLRTQTERPTTASLELATNAVTPLAPLWPTLSTDLVGLVDEGGRSASSNLDDRTRARSTEEAGAWVANTVEDIEDGTSVSTRTAPTEFESLGPVPIAIPALTVTPMTRLEPVAIAPLDVSPLDVPELLVTEGPQEQK